MKNQFKASDYHKNYIEEINKQMETILEKTMKDVMPHVKLMPAVVEKKVIGEYYDIESEDGSADRLRVSKLTSSAKSSLNKKFNVDFSKFEGFVIVDEFYRYGASYIIAFNDEKTFILNKRDETGLIIEEGNLKLNTLDDSEGLLWLLCTLIDVFFDLEPMYN